MAEIRQQADRGDKTKINTIGYQLIAVASSTNFCNANNNGNANYNGASNANASGGLRPLLIGRKKL